MSLFGVTLFDITFNIEGSKLERTVSGDQVLVFMGPTGSGKSRLINYLLKKDIVVSKRSFDSVTKDLAVTSTLLSCHEAKIENCKYDLIDTQGLLDTKMSYAETVDIVKKSIDKNVKRASRFIIVFNGTNRFNQPNIDALREIIENFELYEGERKKHVLIIFTHCESIKKDDLMRLKQEILTNAQIRRIHCQLSLERMATGEKKTVENIMFIGLPNYKDFDDEMLADYYRTRLDQQFQSMWNVLQVKHPLIETKASFKDKYCNLL